MAEQLINLIKREKCPCCLEKFSSLEKWVLYTCCCHAVCTNCYNKLADEKNHLSIKKCITCRRYPPELFVIHLSKDQNQLIKFEIVTFNSGINNAKHPIEK